MFSPRQQQILEASVKLIDENGIQGFTIKNLSKEIGISEGGIYRHFDSKVMILSAILDTFKQKIDAYRTSSEDRKNLPAEEQLSGFFSMIFNFLSANPALISVIFAEEIFQNEPTLTEEVIDIQIINDKIIKDIIKGLTLNSKLSNSDSDIITLIFFGSIRLLARKWKLSNYNFSLIQEGDKLINTILKLIK